MIERSDILLADEVVLETADVRRVLARRVAELLSSDGRGRMRVARIVVPVASVDPFRWLAAQASYPRLFWSGRDDRLEVAAAGAADLIEGRPGDGYDRLRAKLDRVLAYSDEQVRYFGGFRFDHAAASDTDWEPFGTFRFVLPRFELDRREDGTLLVCNLLLPRDRMRIDTILAQIDALA